MNTTKADIPTLAEKVAAAQSSVAAAIAELETEHTRLYAARAETKATIERLWSIPLRREQLAKMVQQGIHDHGAAFFARMGWRKLFAAFTKPTGKRPDIPKGKELGDGRMSDRQQPLSLADFIALDKGRHWFHDLQTLLVGARDASSDTLALGGLPAGYSGKSAGLLPAFLSPHENGQPQPLTREDLAQALCFFCGEQVQRLMMETFDAQVPADFPQKPDDVSEEEWGATVEDREAAIKQAVEQEKALLAQLRHIDQQVLGLATPGSDAHKLARARILNHDSCY